MMNLKFIVFTLLASFLRASDMKEKSHENENEKSEVQTETSFKVPLQVVTDALQLSYARNSTFVTKYSKDTLIGEIVSNFCISVSGSSKAEIEEKNENGFRYTLPAESVLYTVEVEAYTHFLGLMAV